MNAEPAQIPKKAVVRVLGCKVNQAEAAAMAKILEAHGYEIDVHATTPDLVVVNTCCVTHRAEGKSRRLVGRLAEQFPHSRLIVTGCLAEINPVSLREAAGPLVDLRTTRKEQFVELLSAGDSVPGTGAGTEKVDPAVFADLGAAELEGRARSFLKIQDGCSQRCTYCIVPDARGPSRSLAPERVLAHCRELDASGAGEIVLTGIHLGTYGRDLEPRTSLVELIQRVLRQPAEVRFRVSSVEAQEISPELIELVTRHPRMCRHFHIPLQSGDDAILRRMGRPYDTAMVRDLVKRITGTALETCIGLDVMVGFPGEDDESFRRTEAFIRELQPSYLHVFPFSPRPGTPAASFTPRVPDENARERVAVLRELSHTLRASFYERFLGATLHAVAESDPDPVTGTLRARTDNYIPVVVEESSGVCGARSFPVTIERIVNGDVHGSLGSGEVLRPS